MRPGTKPENHPLTQLKEKLSVINPNIILDWHSCLEGGEIYQTAINSFGKVDVLINNAGVLKDVSFMKMKESDWNDVINIHLHATRNNCTAV